MNNILLFFGEYFIKYAVVVFGSILFGVLILEFIKRHILSNEIEAWNKTVVITGCDTGFGHMLAKKLDSKGFLVFACCLFPNGVGASNLRKNTSKNLKILPLDVTKEESVKEAVQFVKDNLGLSELWAVVNNAGIHKGFTVEFTDFADFRDCMEINAFGYLRVMKAFLPLLRRYKGRLVNVISNAGRIPIPHLTPYCMSKYAVAGLNDCLRLELAPLGVSVISIEPEMFRTALNDQDIINKSFDVTLAAVDDDIKESYGENYIKSVKKMKDAFLHFTSPNVELVIKDLESAICQQFPNSIYKTRQSIITRILQNIYQVAPVDIQDLMYKSTCFAANFLNFEH